MAESGFQDAETQLDGAARIPATRDWLHHPNKSLSRLNNVQKSSYRLGGGPREREVNCHCNYRSKHKSSFLSLESEPPRLTRDSQETASMPDLSVPEILRQFNNRQSQKTKQRRRPYSPTVYSTKDKTMKGKSLEEKSFHDNSSFISIKGQVVSPQSRPPPGTAAFAESRADDTGYKGLVHLDKRQLEQDRRATLAGLRKYSAAFGDDDEATSPAPPPPRASPEPSSPRRNSLEFRDSAEGSFSEEDDNDEHDDQINKTSDSPSESSDVTGGSRSFVFAIPTAGSYVGSDDDEASSDFAIGRLSADYVVESDTFLSELAEKRQTEDTEISDLLHDMESAKEKLNKLHFSPRDLEVESVPVPNRGHDIPETPANPSVHVVNIPLEETSVAGEKEADRSLYDAVWVEEPISSYFPNSLPVKSGRPCSSRFLSQHPSRPARVSKHRSESALVLKGKTVEFFDADELAAKNRLSDLRRASESVDGVRGFAEAESRNVEKNYCNREDLQLTRKMGTKPPLPRSHVSKNSRKQSLKENHPTGVVKTNGNAVVEADHRCRKSSLKKSSSDGNIPQTVANFKPSLSDTNATKKSVTFSVDVPQSEDDGGVCSLCISRENSPADQDGSSDVLCRRQEANRLNTAFNQTREPCSLSNSGVVIQNGLEMKEPLSEKQDSLNTPTTLKPEKAERPLKTNRSTKAKILAKVKEHPCEEKLCTCRTVTRPTTALLEEVRNGKTGAKETFLVSSTKGEKLLEQRPTRPISAPMKRPEGNAESVKRPRSSRRPRAMSATFQTKKSGSEGSQSRPRPSSAHVGRISSKDAHRSRAAAKVLKEGFLLKEKPPPPLPSGVKQNQKTRQDNVDKRTNNNSSNLFISRLNEKEIAASEECQEVFARLQEKGIDISMETLKRGLMAPARRADELSLASMGSSSGLLSRPENWLPEEYARVKIWKDVLKHAN